MQDDQGRDGSRGARDGEVGAGDAVDALVPAWRRTLPESVVTGLELGKRMSRLGQLLEQAVKAELAEIGLSYAEFDVLAALHRIGPPHRMRPSELTRSLWLTSGGTSNLLHRLEGAGYIERSINEKDARSRYVQLTEYGQRVAGQAMLASVRAHEQVFGAVPDEAMRAAADALREVLLGARRPR